jgi:hypothetical protein
MDHQSEPVTMWFDRRIVLRVSPIHGTGVFATHPIRAGERLIWVSGGIVYTSEDWRTGRIQLDPEQYNEGQIGDDLFIATPKSLYYYVNHSCDPNMLNDTAWRDIEPARRSPPTTPTVRHLRATASSHARVGCACAEGA